jgi:hypothetical protein
MVAVFSWGLEIKISHYKTHPPSSTTPIASKLLTEKHSEHAIIFREEDTANESVEKVELPSFMVLHAPPVFSLMLHQVELSLCDPCKYDSHGPNLMHLPPPRLS